MSSACVIVRIGKKDYRLIGSGDLPHWHNGQDWHLLAEILIPSVAVGEILGCELLSLIVLFRLISWTRSQRT